ncbi:MAG TPA: phosphoribosyltransferase [Solirubrobacteraceae bacterium]|jgi:predicted phosphoribosyltransferase
MSERFADRTDAGRRLAAALRNYAGRAEAVVLALPRGGVPVAHEVARGLGLALEPFLVRKLGVPGHEELAMGAIASGGARVLNHEVLAGAGLSNREVEDVTRRELQTLEENEQKYRGDRPPRALAGMTAILVDDGLATGATMRAAIQALRNLGAAAIVVAVPVAPVQTCAALRAEVDELVCLNTPQPFTAVGFWYRDFSPVSDEEVRELLSDQPSSGTASS